MKVIVEFYDNEYYVYTLDQKLLAICVSKAELDYYIQRFNLIVVG